MVVLHHLFPYKLLEVELVDRVGMKMEVMEQMAEGLLGLMNQDMLGVREQYPPTTRCICIGR
jgi:hypothetical protein